eukprot:UN24435
MFESPGKSETDVLTLVVEATCAFPGSGGVIHISTEQVIEFHDMILIMTGIDVSNYIDLPFFLSQCGDRDVTIEEFEIILVESFIRKAEINYKYKVLNIVDHADGKFPDGLGNAMFIDSVHLENVLHHEMPGKVMEFVSISQILTIIMINGTTSVTDINEIIVDYYKGDYGVNVTEQNRQINNTIQHV